MDGRREGLFSPSVQPGKEHARESCKAPAHVHGEEHRLCSKFRVLPERAPKKESLALVPCNLLLDSCVLWSNCRVSESHHLIPKCGGYSQACT